MHAQRLTSRAHYDPTLATRLANVSKQVYRTANDVEALAQGPWNCSEFLFIDVDATQCCVTANYEGVVVSFRGSEANLEDWVVDLDFSLVPGPLGGRVHEGFFDALSAVWSLLDHEVQRLLHERPRPLWITGHSLGGALATLAAARWHEQGVPVSSVYTYGQPRAGDAEYCRNYDFALRARAFRVVNNVDIVTRTPPRSMGYSHCGTLIYLTEEGTAEADLSWWQKFLNGWCGTIDTIFDWCGEGVEDHRMDNYLSRLDALAPLDGGSVPITPPFKASSSRLVRPRRRAA